MKRAILGASALVVLLAGLAGCHGPDSRGVTVTWDVTGLDDGELISAVPEADLSTQDVSRQQTVTSEAGRFTLHIPMKAGQGDWYKIWIGSVPSPSKSVTIYLDSDAGDMQVTSNGAVLNNARFSGSPLAEEFNDFTNAIGKVDSLEKSYTARGIKTENLTGSVMEQWIAAHPSSAYGTALLEKYKIGGPIPEDTVVAYFGRRNAAALNNMPAVRMREWLRTTAGFMPGRIAPDFTQPDTAGKAVSLKDFRGRYVLVDFWASWCGPCRAENPNVVKAYGMYKDRGFTVLGVSLDRPGAKADWMDAIHHDHLAWTQVSDLKFWNNAAVRFYHIQAVPSNFLIDPNGVIIARDIRGDELERKLQEVLGNKSL